MTMTADHGARQPRQGTRPGDEQYTRGDRLLVQLLELRDEVAAIGEIDVMTARLDTRVRNPVILPLVWAGRMDDGERVYCPELGLEVTGLLVQRRSRDRGIGILFRELIDKNFRPKQIAARDDQLGARDSGKPPANTCAEVTCAAKHENLFVGVHLAALFTPVSVFPRHAVEEVHEPCVEAVYGADDEQFVIALEALDDFGFLA